MNRVLRYGLAIAWTIPMLAAAQPGEFQLRDKGLPYYMRHFPAHEYKAHPQNWSIVQDARGVIYAGNYDGVLVYDGVGWEIVATPSNTTVRSLAVGMDGRVFVGLQGDFGYIGGDSLGQYTFVSLLDYVPPDERKFWDVWGTHATETDVYFQTKNELFRWDGSSLRIWKSGSGFHTSYCVNDTIYVLEKSVGLKRLIGDTLSVIPGGEYFAEEQIFGIGQRSDGHLVIATQTRLFEYDGEQSIHFATEADDFLKSHRIYHAIGIGGEYLALGLLDGGGLLMLDGEGRVVEHLTEGNGLPDGWINHLFVDAQGGLWLALNNQGIVRLDPLGQISRFGRASGLEGLISDIGWHRESLFVATSTGLFRLVPSWTFLS